DASKNLNALLDKSGPAPDGGQRLAIEADAANNALLVGGTSRDTEWVRQLIEQLDQPPQQVQIEVIIAEITLGKSFDLGFEWSTIESPENGRTTVIGRSRPGETDQIMDLVSEGLFPQGLTLGVARGVMTDALGNVIPRIPFLLRALAEDRDVNILSSVPLVTQNNSPATVSVVENIPVLRSTIEGGSGTARDTIQNIDRMDVGIKFSVTPNVNADGQVRLELNPSIEAIIDEGPADQPFTPTIAKREVTTVVTVADGATVAISGLIREDRINAISKVPLLGDIPLLGRLFQRQVTRRQRTNLLILVTPTVLGDQMAATDARQRLELRTGLGAAVESSLGSAPDEPDAAP
ncbi:MAG: hypothetical protein K9N49_05310, partial [Candidatus Marinimicrobia bacterium]|nr:hypothetical protein [Candidatus Neomarinimicrobiota bacterium]